jgi:CubicO group peptidase (beta-lactamase class C family)
MGRAIVADVQGAVQTLLDALVRTNRERGLQVAVYLDGDLVVDAWAGLADPATGQPVDGETLFTAFSATKGITATVIHLLAERGQLAYDDPVTTYWPEFAAHGKARITVRHVLTHTAGVPQMPRAIPVSDWAGQCRATAALVPLSYRCGNRGSRAGITP